MAAELNDLKTWTNINTLTLTEVYNYMVFKFGSIIIDNYDKAIITALIYTWHLANVYKYTTLAATIAQQYNPIENYDRYETRSATHTPNLTDTLTHNTTQAQSGTTATAQTATDETTTFNSVSGSHDVDYDESGSDSTVETHGVIPFDGAYSGGNTPEYVRDTNRKTINYGKSADTDNSYSETNSGSNDRELTSSETITHGRQDKTTGTETTTHTGSETNSETIRAHGNIGVTTVADMLEGERTKTAQFVLLDVYLTDLIKNISVGIYSSCDTATEQE